MERWIRRVTMAVICLAGALAQAATLNNLYEEQLKVETQSAATLRQGASRALEQVLIRVSGQADVGQNPTVAKALADAQGMLTQYRYLNREDETGENQLILELNFSRPQVESLLQSAGLPVWSANRPAVLVWLVEDTRDGRHFVGTDDAGALYEPLREEARRRGVILQFPLMDLTDTGNLSEQDVWQMRLDTIRRASSRYDAPYVLVGRASELSNGQWVASWSLLQSDQVQRIDSEGMEGRDVVAPVVDRVADTQASNFSVVAGADSESTLIYVKGINSFATYADLVTYLENLSVVEHANTVWLSPRALVIELLLNGDMAKVQRFLTLDSQLQLLKERPEVVPEVAQLPIGSFYRWRN